MTLTLGVEEEYLLLDPVTGENVPLAAEARDALPAALSHLSRPEFRLSMLEMVTPVCGSLAEVAEQLRTVRRAAGQAAASVGAQLVAVGATPVGEPKLTVTEDARYKAIAAHYGPIVADPAVCGCHVHVGVGEDRAVAVEVGNYLRPWLPVVQALCVNSPFHAGRDTGHASWRAMQLDRWPSLGPTPHFSSPADWDRTVRLLAASGTMLDESLVLWFARPSERYPTVEVRVADVCLTVGDTVLLTGLVRGLVGTALEEMRAGRPAPSVPDGLLRAAHWNAAHAGVAGTLLDVRRQEARPAWDLVGDLVAWVRPALDSGGDLAVVEGELARVRAEGTGAVRQRRLFARSGNLQTVLAELSRLSDLQGDHGLGGNGDQ